MFEQLTKALEDHFPEDRSKIGLKALCEASGLRIGMWAERLKSMTLGHLVRQELEQAGFTFTVVRRGRFTSFTFTHTNPTSSNPKQ